jgi:hypothetical protein
MARPTSTARQLKPLIQSFTASLCDAVDEIVASKQSKLRETLGSLLGAVYSPDFSTAAKPRKKRTPKPKATNTVKQRGKKAATAKAAVPDTDEDEDDSESDEGGDEDDDEEETRGAAIARNRKALMKGVRKAMSKKKK